VAITGMVGIILKHTRRRMGSTAHVRLGTSTFCIVVAATGDVKSVHCLGLQPNGKVPLRGGCHLGRVYASMQAIVTPGEA